MEHSCKMQKQKWWLVKMLIFTPVTFFAKIGIKALQGTLESRKLLLEVLEVPTPEQQLALRFDAYVFFS